MPNPRWRRYLRFFGPDVRADVDDELRFHLDERIAEYEHRGLSRAAAERAARERMGDLDGVRADLERHDQARLRAGTWGDTMDRIRQDCRLALRALRTAPTFTVSAVVILGVGIGMAVAMVTVFRSVLVERLPVTDQDRLVVLWTQNQGGAELTAGKQVVTAYRRETRTMRDVAGVVHWGATASPLADGDRTLIVRQAIVDGNFFDVLGARPVLGRLLTRDDEIGGRFQPESFRGLPHAMVLSWGTWQREFGGDSAVLGRRLVDPYSQWSYTVVGVAPPGLDYPTGVSEWIAAGRDATASEVVVGRLRPGVTLAAARAEYLAAMTRLEPRLRAFGAAVHTLPDVILGDIRPTLVILVAAVALLLVVACTNVGNLLLLRAAQRRREIAIRRALGAGYGDLVRQLLAESAALALAGGALGLLCAVALLRLLLALAPSELPRTDAIRVSGTPLWSAVAVTLVAVVAFGIAPALLGARADVATGLRPSARSGHESRRGRRTRELLVAWQVALALVMVSGAGLLMRSLGRLQHLDLGLRPEHLAMFSLSLPSSGYDSEAKVFALGDALFPRLRELPGVVAVTPVIIPPFIAPSAFQFGFDIEGQSPEEAKRNPLVPVEGAGPDYFRTMGLPILRGRGFSPQLGADAPPEVVVSETIARRFWPGADPIGKRIADAFGDSTWLTVVGVVPDVHYRTLREGTPTVFLQWRRALWQGNVAIRTSADFNVVLPAIRRAVRALDPRVVVWDAATMDELMAEPLAAPRLAALLLAGFGIVAALLAAVGLYGVTASVVRQRTHEMGVRLALGASPSRLRREVLARAIALVAGGALAGVAGSLLSGRLYRALLFEVSPSDPLALLAACSLLVAVGAAAAYLPARRATRIDPAQALRAD